MVNAMVERATSDMLIGPDWSRNIEICDICNSDPAQAKDVVKGIKNRLRSKRPKVQLLALTLLETIVKNCGDIVHMLVAERELPREMVKIVKKKPDFHVKEKILILINTWQEAFGGPRGRYPQYFAAYQELLRLGAVFPRISEMSASASITPGTHHLVSHPQNLGIPQSGQPRADSSVEPEFPTLSLTEIENARAIMIVLEEMLGALRPDNKEELKQDVIVDLVEKCRAYKLRVVHLVNSTTDEPLLCQGLAVNDDLQRLLAKYESLSSRTISLESYERKPEHGQSLVNMDAPLIDTGDEQSERSSTSGSNLGTQLLLPAPTTNGQSTTSAKVDPKIDLLSGDYINSSTSSESLALVPVGEPQPASPTASHQNILALVDMFPQSNNQSSNPNPQAYSSLPHFQQQSNGQFPQPSSFPNGSVTGQTAPQHEQPLYSQGFTSTWNGQINQQQLPDSPVYGAQTSSAFPPPPWEAQLDNGASSIISQPQELHVTQPDLEPSQPNGSYMNPITSRINNQPMVGGLYHQPMLSGHMAYMYPQPMQANQMAGYNSHEQMQNAQYINQNMSGLSLNGGNAIRNSSYSLSAPSGKPMKPEDKLFGDLVDISQFKPAKAAG